MKATQSQALSARLGQLFRDSSLYVVSNVLRRGFSVITMPIFTRYLSTSEYGILSIVGTVQNMLEPLYELGMAQASTRFYYDCQDEEERKVLFGTLLLFSLSMTLVLSILLLLVGEWGWGLLSGDIPFFPYIALTIGTVCLGNIGVLPRTLFRVQNRVPLFFRISLAQTALTVFLSVLFVMGFSLGPVGPVLAAFLVAIVFFGIYSYYLQGEVRLTFRWSLVKQALAFGLPEIPVRMGTWALKVADRLLLQYFTSLSVVAVYSVGYGVGKMPFDLVGNAIHWAIVPFFYDTATKESEADSKVIFSRVATYNVAVLAGLGLGTMLFGRELILLLATDEYLEAERVLPFVIIASFLQALFYIPSKGIYLQKKTAYLPVLFLVPAGLNIGLNLILIPRLGMMGAAWATLIAYSVMITLTLVVSQRLYYIPYEYGRISKVILVAIGLSLLSQALIAGEAAFLVRVMAKAGVLGGFPVLLYVLGFFEASEIDVARRRFALLVQRATQG